MLYSLPQYAAGSGFGTEFLNKVFTAVLLDERDILYYTGIIGIVEFCRRNVTDMSMKLGIDIGSTTLKAVILDGQNRIIYQSYERHLSNIRQVLQNKIEELGSYLKGESIKVAITGSAGLGITGQSGIPFVQEVFATAEGVKRFYPQTEVVIELGGEDAKIIFLKGVPEERMNSTCAGGTGAFIDQMATLLDVTPAQMNRLAEQHTTIYPIASRCGVFAKTDIQALLNQGAAKEDVAASIFQAVVGQTISGLAQGRPITGRVLFLGGPLAFLPELRRRFTETLQLSDDMAVFPQNGEHFVALSCACCAENTEQEYSYEQLVRVLTGLNFAGELTGGLKPLFESELEYQSFQKRHGAETVPQGDLASYQGKAYLGIDAGSTTTKIVLIDRDDRVLYSKYCSNLGNPLPIVREALLEIYQRCGDRVQIAGSSCTGYGEDLIKNAFGIDYGVVETVAHYTAAKRFDPQVDFIIDIGGQDIKCFHIKDNAIGSVMLNEACSSGCGSFLESFAKSLGYQMKEFVELALFAPHPVDLGTRCTVFMNSSVKQAQKNGALIEDIAAGLAMSVVKNAIYKVIRASRADQLGQHIVVQGGTFLNDAVLRSFEQLMGKNVVRPAISGLMGAYGAALYAKDRERSESAFLTEEQLEHFSHKSKATVCKGCTNHCRLTVNTFSNGRSFISGNRCERPVKGASSSMPNLYEWKRETLQKIKTQAEQQEGSRGVIGLPMVLNFYETLPFWTAVFTKLDFSVRVSEFSSREIHHLGEHTIPSDTVCYPAKLVHGHVFRLQQLGADVVFYPCMSYNFDEGQTDNHYNCPVVAYYPEVIEANLASLNGIRLLYPYLDMNRPKKLKERLYEELHREWPAISKGEISAAVDAGFAALEDYKSRLRQQGEQVLEEAARQGQKIILLAGRPYHADPEINHGIDQLISSLGLVTLSEDSVAHLADNEGVQVLNQWTYHARMYRAAYLAARYPNMQVVQLISFGCGIDAVTSDEVASLLRSHGKLYTGIKIDEIQNLGAVKIRLRSLLAAMEE